MRLWKVPRLPKAREGSDLSKAICGPCSYLPPRSCLLLPGTSWHQNHLSGAPGALAPGPRLPLSNKRKRKEALLQGCQRGTASEPPSPKPALHSTLHVCSLRRGTRSHTRALNFRGGVYGPFQADVGHFQADMEIIQALLLSDSLQNVYNGWTH